MQKYLEKKYVEFQFNTEVTNVLFGLKAIREKIAKAIECKDMAWKENCSYKKTTFVTSGAVQRNHHSASESCANGDAKFVQVDARSLEKYHWDASFGHPTEFLFWFLLNKLGVNNELLWMIDHSLYTDICKRSENRARLFTGGIVAVRIPAGYSLDDQRTGTVQEIRTRSKVCVWVYGLFTDAGDYIKKKPMKEGVQVKEITRRVNIILAFRLTRLKTWLRTVQFVYHHDALYYNFYAMQREQRWQTWCCPDGCVKLTIPWTVCRYTKRIYCCTRYSTRTAMSFCMDFLNCWQSVPEVWAVFMISEKLLDSGVKADGWKISTGDRTSGTTRYAETAFWKLLKGTVVESTQRSWCDRNYMM